MTANQQEVLNLLTEVLALSPDVRVGQLMAHLGFLGEVNAEKSLGELDDDELIAILLRHRAELASRTSASSSVPLASDVVSIAGASIVPLS